MVTQIKNMITSVMKNEKNTVKKFEDFLIKNGWSNAYPKEKMIKELNLLINEKLPNDPSRDLTDMILFQKRTPVKLSTSQKESFKHVIELIKNAPTQMCQHENLVIAPFGHGGGFCPNYNMPEVICLDCGLNISLYIPKDISEFQKELGIKTTEDEMAKLWEWANSCKGVLYAEEITSDPINAYNKSENKWNKEIPFKVVNIKAFESQSGL